MATEGFFPKDALGHHVDKFDSFSEVLPIITFVVSLLASAYGMAKFIMDGPVPITPKHTINNGNPIINGIGMVFLNLMFSFRLFAMEAIFFSYYQSYDKDFNHHKTIPAVIAHDELRVLIYLLPSFISIIINNFRLAQTYNGCRKLYLKHPQIFLTPGFTPIMYEGMKQVAEDGKTTNKIQIWKTGSILNAIYTGCVPQIGLIVSEYARGVVKWDFMENEDVPHTYTNAVIKYQYGNFAFAMITLVLCLSLVPLFYGRLLIFCTPEELEVNVSFVRLILDVYCMAKIDQVIEG